MKPYPCLKATFPSNARAGILDPVRTLGTLMLTIMLFVTPVSAGTVVLTLDEHTIPAAIQCGETWTEAGLDLMVMPTDSRTCGLSLCDLFPNPDHLTLFPGILTVDLTSIAGAVNSAVVIAGSGIGVCITVAFYNGATVVDSTIGGCAVVDTSEVFASGLPVDRLVLDACYHSNVFEIRIEFDPTTTSVGPTIHTPVVRLESRPNPFNVSTLISFDLNTSGRIELRIYDIAGRAVRSLLDAELPAGRREVVWDGRDASGRQLGPGVYFAGIAVDGRVSAAGKIIVTR